MTRLNAIKWPDETDFKGAIQGNMWHFYQTILSSFGLIAYFTENFFTKLTPKIFCCNLRAEKNS